MDRLRIVRRGDRLGLHFRQRTFLRRAAVEIGNRIGRFRGRRRRKLVRDRACKAVLALATTTAAATAASAAARPALAIGLIVAAGEARLFLGFIVLGLAFLASSLPRRGPAR